MNFCFLRFPDFKEKAVTLSYDDGVAQDKRLIGIMKKNGLKGTFNINSELFAPQPSEGGKGRMSKEEAYETYASSGMEIAVHGARHYSLTEKEACAATADVIKDRINLEKMFGRVVKGMAYANGAYNDGVVEILKKCGISYARTTVSTRSFNIPEDWLRLPATCHHNAPELMELAERFLEPISAMYCWGKAPKLFYLWGHAYEFDNNDNWQVIEAFAEKVGNRDDIWYATNGEIYEYVQAFRALQFSADDDMVYNPTAKDVYLKWFGDENVVIPAGKTVVLAQGKKARFN